VSLLVGLHIIEGLQHGLHELILGGDQLFKVDIVVGLLLLGCHCIGYSLCSPSDGLVKGKVRFHVTQLCAQGIEGKMLPFYLS
jgi:hypothetical protein